MCVAKPLQEKGKQLRIEVVPGFFLDDPMLELLAVALAQHAPDLGPPTRDFILEPDWDNVPNVTGEISKSERIFLAGPDRTVIANVWHRPDIRGRDEPIPHNHPWEEFHSYILRGGYREQRWHRTTIDPETDCAALSFEDNIIHASPTVNQVLHLCYHQIPEVEPGTITLMVCGPRTPDGWSHLDISSGKTRRDQPVDGFDDMLAALNPHRRARP